MIIFNKLNLNVPQPNNLNTELTTPDKTNQNVSQKNQAKVLKAYMPIESSQEDPRPAETMPRTTIFPMQRRTHVDKKNKATEKEAKKKEEPELVKLEYKPAKIRWHKGKTPADKPLDIGWKDEEIEKKTAKLTVAEDLKTEE